MFTPRTTKPSNNLYYIRKQNGGYNGAILGSPNDPTANVLANCVGYANGRFGEIIGKNTIEYQLICNAENFIEVAKSYGLKISDKPTLGGVMVWQKGATLSGNDGAGHVAVVEKIIDSNTIVTSESGYGCSAIFWTITRSNSNGKWGAGSGYSFRGCIVNPAVDDQPQPTPTEYKEYTVKLGDTLSKIAKEYNTTVNAILAINPQITNPNLIYPGQIIKIPVEESNKVYTVQVEVTSKEDADKICKELESQGYKPTVVEK